MSICFLNLDCRVNEVARDFHQLLIMKIQLQLFILDEIKDEGDEVALHLKQKARSKILPGLLIFQIWKK